MGLFSWIVMAVMFMIIVFGAGFIWENKEAFQEYSKEKTQDIKMNIGEGLREISTDELSDTLCGRFGREMNSYFLNKETNTLEIECLTFGG